MLDLVVLANDRPARSVSGAAETAPARPEDEREQCAERAHGEKDPTDRVDLDPAHRRVDGPDEDRPGSDEKKADSHTHIASPFDGILCLCRENAETPCEDTAVEELQKRRAYLCRLTPDRVLESQEEALAFLRDRGMLTRTPDSALPSLFEACHEEPYAAGSRGFGAWPATKYPWYFELAERPDVHELKVHNGKSILLTDESLALVDGICRSELARMEGEWSGHACLLTWRQRARRHSPTCRPSWASRRGS